MQSRHLTLACAKLRQRLVVHLSVVPALSVTLSQLATNVIYSAVSLMRSARRLRRLSRPPDGIQEEARQFRISGE